MITDIQQRSVRSTLDRNRLPDYWNGYFSYQNLSPTLHQLTESELINEVNLCKSKPKQFVDSQVVISNILTKLGLRHNFHRQFSEQFPDLSREQILGMQLYTIMLNDNLIWIYIETQHPGHLFPHATYFVP